MKPSLIFQKIGTKQWNETGSALPSALLLLFLLTGFLTSFSYHAKNQIASHHLLQKGYEARAMIALTEAAYTEHLHTSGTERVGTYYLSDGEVIVTRLSSSSVEFVADLPKGFSVREIRKIDEPIPLINESFLQEELSDDDNNLLLKEMETP